MAWLSTEDLKEYRQGDFPSTFMVRFQKGHRQSDLVAEDLDLALTLFNHWREAGSFYVEIFRILDSGELNPTIGGYRLYEDQNVSVIH